MAVEINNLGSLGVVRTVRGYQLPAQAWTLGENVRIVETGIGKVGLGWTATLGGTPGVAPSFLMAVKNASQTYWLYTSLTKGYVFDGSSHTDITRAGGGGANDYSATDASFINGTILGGIPIINTGNDIPQFWALPFNPATDLANLTNWPSTYRTRVIRAFGPTLVAGNITISGTNHPHRVLVSHPADPGTVPSSWDVADPTVDVVQVDLPDVNSGLIVNLLPLRGQMFIYKESAVWRMRQVGGRFVMAFDAFLETAGSIAPRCVAITGDGQRHVSFTYDDLIAHDGVRARSLLSRRYKRYLTNQIDPDFQHLSFLFDNPDFNEMWFLFAEAGQSMPSRALVWNYSDGEAGQFTEVPITTGIIAAGIGKVEDSGSVTWASDPETWSGDDGSWNEAQQRKVILADSTNTEFWMLDASAQRNGVNFTATLQRDGLGLIEPTKDGGSSLVDFSTRKYLERIWIKLTGGPVNIRLGGQEMPDGPITWTGAQSFDPSTQNYLDFEVNCRAFAIEISSTTNVSWQLESYMVETHVVGGAG